MKVHDSVSWGYRRAYEELAHVVVQRYPMLNIEGTTYPPPQWRAFAAKIVTSLKFLVLALIIVGINPFPYFGLGTPNFVTYANENKVSYCVYDFSARLPFFHSYRLILCFKVSVCLMCFFIGGLIEGQLLSTGAFEITFNGMIFLLVFRTLLVLTLWLSIIRL